MGVLAAARAFGLDFVPVKKEPYDLVLGRETLEHQLLAPFWELLGSPAFRSAVEALGGYQRPRWVGASAENRSLARADSRAL
jgi:putative molybdopterin biosynthesis protein